MIADDAKDIILVYQKKHDIRTLDEATERYFLEKGV